MVTFYHPSRLGRDFKVINNLTFYQFKDCLGVTRDGEVTEVSGQTWSVDSF